MQTKKMKLNQQER